MEAVAFERDEFQRKPIAERLAALLSSDIDISPMIIDGSWGTGKTTFCQELIKLIKEQKFDEYQIVYLDAFRSDHSGDPLLALLAQIIKDCTPDNATNEPLSAKRQEWTKKLARAIGFTAKTVAKAVAGHALKQSADNLIDGFQQVMSSDQAKETADTFIDTAVKLSDQAIDATVEILLKEQIEAEKNLDALKACLIEFSAERPIILFIDELDRCRPDYAVAMLETVKHVFDIPSVKAVLVTNSQQLHAAINHRYGLTVDAQKYLDKFLKYRFRLPERTKDSLWQNSSLHFNNLVMKNERLSQIFSDGTKDFVASLVEQNHLSLREIETFVRYLEIYYCFQQDNAATRNISGCKLLIVTAVYIYCFEPNVLQSIKQETISADQIKIIFPSVVTRKQKTENLIVRNHNAEKHDITNDFANMLIEACQFNGKLIVRNNVEIMEFWSKYADRFLYGVEQPYGQDFFKPIRDVIGKLQLEM